MSDDQVQANLNGMDDLDLDGWNNADWHGVFARQHTDDVYVDFKGSAWDQRGVGQGGGPPPVDAPAGRARHRAGRAALR